VQCNRRLRAARPTAMHKLKTETVRPTAPMDKTARCSRRARAVRLTAVLKGQTAAVSRQPVADRAEAMADQEEVKAADRA